MVTGAESHIGDAVVWHGGYGNVFTSTNQGATAAIWRAYKQVLHSGPCCRFTRPASGGDTSRS
jgi:hypothetical protein